MGQWQHAPQPVRCKNHWHRTCYGRTDRASHAYVVPRTVGHSEARILITRRIQDCTVTSRKTKSRNFYGAVQHAPQPVRCKNHKHRTCYGRSDRASHGYVVPSQPYSSLHLFVFVVIPADLVLVHLFVSVVIPPDSVVGGLRKLRTDN